jgi:hypothetical protein
MNMNVDYGFSQLFTTLKSLRDNENESVWGEKGSVIEQKLPRIDCSLLRNLNVYQYRYQQASFRPKRLHFGIAATCQCLD